MSSLFRRLNIFTWPMWLKLVFGFVLAIGVPTLLVVIIASGGISTLGATKLEQYLTETGMRQQTDIVRSLSQAYTSLGTIATTEDYEREMLRILRPGGLNVVNARTVSTMLQSLLIGSGQQYRRLRLLNIFGDSMSSVTAISMVASGRSDASSPAYVQALNTLQTRSRDTTVIVFGQDPVTVEMTWVVRDENDEPIGFLVATLDEQRLVADHLAGSGATFPSTSYVLYGAQAHQFLMGSTPEATASNTLLNLPVVDQVFEGFSGLESYSISSSAQPDMLAYFTPIPNPAIPTSTLFVLVTEASLNAPVSAVQEYFVGPRIFVAVLGMLLVLAVLVILFNQIITPPLKTLHGAVEAITQGDFSRPVPAAGRGDEIGNLSAAFVDMRQQVRSLLDDLEARVAARTRDINATQEISRYAATERNLQTLMDQVVDLILEKFPNIYHAQIFLLDNERMYAVLRSSTGEPGQKLLARGHRLAVGSISVIGQVIDQQQVIVARDTAISQVHRRNEFLPDTRAELAIPLRVGNQVIGALDVQSKYRNAFPEDEITVLQTMADQIAIAIENARLYQESVRRLEEIEQANRLSTLRTWQEYVYGQRQRGLTSRAGKATGNDLSELRRQAIVEGRVVIGTVSPNGAVPVAIPIKLRGQTLGAVEWELPEADLSEEKLQLALELADRLAVSLDNARLFQESQRATERERIVNTIAAKLTPQTEISEILQTAVREVGQALRAPQVNIRLYRQNGGVGVNGRDGSSNGHEPEDA